MNTQKTSHIVKTPLAQNNGVWIGTISQNGRPLYLVHKNGNYVTTVRSKAALKRVIQRLK